MLITKIIFCVLTFCFGAAIACGFIAFITLLGVFEKLAEKLKACKMSAVIEWLIITGVLSGNLFFMLDKPILLAGNTTLYVVLDMLFNLAGGAFIGCLAGALAETLSIFPILSRRFNVRELLPYILLSAALGKILGSFISLYILKF